MADLPLACACASAPTLVFPCSGSADVGAIADQAGRSLTRRGIGNMYCLAGIGGRLESFLVNAGAAARLVAIDGCPQNCATACLTAAGFANVTSIRLAELGLAKGKSPVTREAIERVVAHTAATLAAAPAEAAA